MAIYAGALAPKKKQDLQDLAVELRIDNGGTKDDLLERIKMYLADHPELAADDRFKGLYMRRKPRQISSNNAKENSVFSEPPQDLTRGSASQVDAPIFPNGNDHAHHEPKEALDRIAEENVPLPPSPARSIMQAVNRAKEVFASANTDAVAEQVEQVQREVRKEALKGMTRLRSFLSNAGNITSMTIVAELLYILYTVIPWKYFLLPLNAPYTTRYEGPAPRVILPEDPPLVSTRVAHIPYPPKEFLLQPWIYSTLIQWAIPTLLIPLCIGTIVSFRPQQKWTGARVDPLTAAIIRIACVFAGDWGLKWSELGISSKWRILSASVAGAFALSEAIGERKVASAGDEQEIESPDAVEAPPADDASVFSDAPRRSKRIQL